MLQEGAGRVLRRGALLSRVTDAGRALLLALLASQLVDKRILVTGGAGYIGSHTVLLLLQSGCEVHILDNLDNSSEVAVERVKELAGDKAQNLTFHKVDLLDVAATDTVCQEGEFDACIHFAGLKAVGESVAKPLWYYRNNVVGTLNLMVSLGRHGCKNIVFSSSATVYGQPDPVPATEDSKMQPTNPYGRTKYFIEEIMRDVTVSDKEWSVVLLRYFNPVGAHPSGRIGEDPRGIPNNLMPFVQQVAVGRRKELTVFGSDYPTPDGTGVRDYIHVMDLAEGHVAALLKIAATSSLDCRVYNLGTGKGTSVLEMVAAFEKACGKEIPKKMADRRPGDNAVVTAKTDLAEKELGWTAKLSIEDACRDQWNWCSNNPYGYSETDPDAEEASEKEKEPQK